GDGRPGRAEIGGLVEKRTEVILPMARFGDIDGARRVMRSEDASHPRVFWAPDLSQCASDVTPTTACVPGHLRLTIVSADPDYAGLRGDSEIVVIVQCWMAAPGGLILAGSLVVRSGLISCQVSPRSFERNKTCAPA